MRTLKSHILLRLLNSYIVDSPEPANISYLWNFGSLLGTCLVLQILTGIFLAMHYQPHVDFAFNSVEHIMRDVNNGWAVRYTHANVASFFFIFVYAHIARGLYYGSYKAPRVLLWAIGVIILIVMMAKMWPNWNNEYTQIITQYIADQSTPSVGGYYERYKNIYTDTIENILPIIGKMLPFNRARTKAISRIGPHNKQVLDIIVCGMLGD